MNNLQTIGDKIAWMADRGDLTVQSYSVSMDGPRMIMWTITFNIQIDGTDRTASWSGPDLEEALTSILRVVTDKVS